PAPFASPAAAKSARFPPPASKNATPLALRALRRNPSASQNAVLLARLPTQSVSKVIRAVGSAMSEQRQLRRRAARRREMLGRQLGARLVEAELLARRLEPPPDHPGDRS